MPFQLVNYSQQDPQWKNDLLGFGGAGDTIGFLGCALTCVAMVSSGHGYPETPRSLNQKLKGKNGFIEAAIVWGALSSIYPQIKTKPLILCYDIDAPLAQIDAAIAAGQPVIVQVDNGPAAGLQTHWVVLYKKQGDDYLMLDPWPYPTESGRNVPMLPRYSQGRSPKQAITAVAMYECLTSGGGTIPGAPSTSTEPAPTPSQPAPVPPSGTMPTSTGVYIRVIAEAPAGLRLRSGPTTGSATLAIEPPQAHFEVIETGAESKIGKPNQWIRVRDARGLEGYVAAWYVEKAAAVPASGPAGGSMPGAPGPSTTPAPSTPPPMPASQKTTVVVSSSVGKSGLRLRKAPTLAGALVAVEKAGTKLSLLEPLNAAGPKIGTAQWLYVRDPKGRRGYVIGQYVEPA